MEMDKRVNIILFAVLSASLLAVAQTKLPVYDVYSVRLNKSDSYTISTYSRGDSYEATNTTVLDLLLANYELAHAELVSKLPKWAETKRFNIRAKISDFKPEEVKSLTAEQKLDMQRRLLTDVFKLTVHREVKVQPAYEMVVAKRGLKMARSDKERGTSLMNDSMLSMPGSTTQDLARRLTFLLRREVVDKTGLTGRYDIDLHWTPLNGDAPLSDGSPTLFTALQEQLGLKLVLAKAQVETLVVDHIEIPDSN
jgi:uncharacterized protein (TIGR03435 family)